MSLRSVSPLYVYKLCRAVFFHDHRQKLNETVDVYAQELHTLFLLCIPSSSPGSKGNQRNGSYYVSQFNQFVAGLKQEIKVKVAGIEGSFEKLLSIAKFEKTNIVHPSSGSRKTADFSKSQDCDCSSRGDSGRFNRQSTFECIIPVTTVVLCVFQGWIESVPSKEQ